ncbi:MAG: hypothetical protein HLX51_01330 [Micrococcaceae bacterium]|nr:hypothetical protein [Micrococcaceae bacterium]
MNNLREALESAISHAPLLWPLVLSISVALSLIAVVSVISLHRNPSNALYDGRELVARLSILGALMLVVFNGLIGLFVEMFFA